MNFGYISVLTKNDDWNSERRNYLDKLLLSNILKTLKTTRVSIACTYIVIQKIDQKYEDKKNKMSQRFLDMSQFSTPVHVWEKKQRLESPSKKI